MPVSPADLALDTTYIPMAKGFVYLTAVVDVANRRRFVQAIQRSRMARLIFIIKLG